MPSLQFFVSAIAMIMVIAACSGQKAGTAIQSYAIIYHYPIVTNKDNKPHYLSLLDTLHVYTLNDCTIYQLQQSRNLADDQKEKGTETYFAYAHRDPTGYLYSASLDTLMRLPVDSMLRKRAFLGVHFEPHPFDSLVRRAVESNLIVDQYFTRLKSRVSGLYDSTYFYYCKDLQTGYSLSKKMDSLSGMRLCKVKMIFNEVYDQQTKKTIRKRELWFEIQDAGVKDEDKVRRLFADFEGKRKRLSKNDRKP